MRPTVTFAAPGTVTVGLRVTDAFGATAQRTRTIAVTAPPAGLS